VGCRAKVRRSFSGLGATFFEADDIPSETKLAWAVGGGAKFFSIASSIKLQAKFNPTLSTTSRPISATPSGSARLGQLVRAPERRRFPFLSFPIHDSKENEMRNKVRLIRYWGASDDGARFAQKVTWTGTATTRALGDLRLGQSKTGRRILSSISAS
jgi:hypothetical protein